MRVPIKTALWVIFLVFLASCVQETSLPPTQESTSSIDIEVITIHSDLVVHPIEREFPYDNCLSAIPLDAGLTFEQVLSEKFYKEIQIGVSGGGELAIPQVAKLVIEAEIKDKFASEKTMVLATSQAAQFTVPAISSQTVIIELKETLREGEVIYKQGGVTFTVPFSYRINLESASVQTKTIICPTPVGGGVVSPTPPEPTITPYPSCDDGFDVPTWTPATTNPDRPPRSIGACWQLGDWGMSLSDGSISILENDGGPRASWYGVTRLIPANARIQMNVRWDKLEDSQIWIGFTDRPDSVSNGKFLVIQATEQPSSILSVFRIKEMEGGLPLPVFDKVSVPFDSGSYFIEMQIDMNRLSIWLNNSSARNFPIFEVEGRYLFIGYLSQTVGVDIDARISNIQILP